MKRRILSFVLMVCMVLTMCPTVAFAAASNQQIDLASNASTLASKPIMKYDAATKKATATAAVPGGTNEAGAVQLVVEEASNTEKDSAQLVLAVASGAQVKIAKDYNSLTGATEKAESSGSATFAKGELPTDSKDSSPLIDAGDTIWISVTESSTTQYFKLTVIDNSRELVPGVAATEEASIAGTYLGEDYLVARKTGDESAEGSLSAPYKYEVSVPSSVKADAIKALTLTAKAKATEGFEPKLTYVVNDSATMTVDTTINGEFTGNVSGALSNLDTTTNKYIWIMATSIDDTKKYSCIEVKSTPDASLDLTGTKVGTAAVSEDSTQTGDGSDNSHPIPLKATIASGTDVKLTVATKDTTITSVGYNKVKNSDSAPSDFATSTVTLADGSGQSGNLTIASGDKIYIKSEKTVGADTDTLYYMITVTVSSAKSDDATLKIADDGSGTKLGDANVVDATNDETGTDAQNAKPLTVSVDKADSLTLTVKTTDTKASALTYKKVAAKETSDPADDTITEQFTSFTGGVGTKAFTDIANGDKIYLKVIAEDESETLYYKLTVTLKTYAISGTVKKDTSVDNGVNIDTVGLTLYGSKDGGEGTLVVDKTKTVETVNASKNGSDVTYSFAAVPNGTYFIVIPAVANSYDEASEKVEVNGEAIADKVITLKKAGTTKADASLKIGTNGTTLGGEEVASTTTSNDGLTFAQAIPLEATLTTGGTADLVVKTTDTKNSITVNYKVAADGTAVTESDLDTDNFSVTAGNGTASGLTVANKTNIYLKLTNGTGATQGVMYYVITVTVGQSPTGYEVSGEIKADADVTVDLTTVSVLLQGVDSSSGTDAPDGTTQKTSTVTSDGNSPAKYTYSFSGVATGKYFIVIAAGAGDAYDKVEKAIEVKTSALPVEAITLTAPKATGQTISGKISADTNVTVADMTAVDVKLYGSKKDTDGTADVVDTTELISTVKPVSDNAPSNPTYTYTFSNVTKGTYFVVVDAVKDTYEEVQHKVTVVESTDNENEDIVLTAPKATGKTIGGTVAKGSISSADLSQVELQLYKADDTSEAGSPVISKTETTAIDTTKADQTDGTYSFANVKNGKYVVKLVGNTTDYKSLFEHVEVAEAGVTPTAVNFELAAPVTAKITAVESTVNTVTATLDAATPKVTLGGKLAAPASGNNGTLELNFTYTDANGEEQTEAETLNLAYDSTKAGKEWSSSNASVTVGGITCTIDGEIASADRKPLAFVSVESTTDGVEAAFNDGKTEVKLSGELSAGASPNAGDTKTVNLKFTYTDENGQTQNAAETVSLTYAAGATAGAVGTWTIPASVTITATTLTCNLTGTIKAPKSVDYTFSVTDAESQVINDAVITVLDPDGEKVTPDGTTYTLVEGKEYTYTVTHADYKLADEDAELKIVAGTTATPVEVSMVSIRIHEVAITTDPASGVTATIDVYLGKNNQGTKQNAVSGKYKLDEREKYFYEVTVTVGDYNGTSGLIPADAIKAGEFTIALSSATVAPPSPTIVVTEGVKVEDATLQDDDDIKAAVAATTVADKASETAIMAAANEIDTAKVTATKSDYDKLATITNSGTLEEKDVMKYVKTFLAIVPTKAEDANPTENKPKSVTFDIKPMAQVVVTKSDTTAENVLTEEIGGKKPNAVKIGQPQELNVAEPVVIKLGLPTGFAANGDRILITHNPTSAKPDRYTSTVVEETAADGTKTLTITFTARSFSPFEFAVDDSSYLYEWNGNAYNTFEEALTAAYTADASSTPEIKYSGKGTVTITVPAVLGSISLHGKSFTLTTSATATVKGETGVTVSSSGNKYTITVAGTPTPAPENLTGVAPTTADNKDGKITGLAADKSYEYRKSGDESWISVKAGSTEITGLAPGTYEVRIAADEGNNTLASPALEVPVPEYKAPETPSNPSDDDDDDNNGGGSSGGSGGGSSGGGGGSSSGGSSGGSSSSGSSTPSGKDTNVSVPATASNGAATAPVDKKTADKMVSDAAKNNSESVNMTVQAPNDASKVTASIPSSSAKDLADKTNADLNVKTPLADVSIPNAAVGTLAGKGNENVGVTVEKDGDDVKITIEADGKDVGTLAGVKADIPASGKGTGTVAVIVNKDGTETVVKKAMVSGGSISVPIGGTATVRIADRSKSFGDASGHWAKDSIDFVTSRDLFNGVSEKQFAPDSQMTRAMLVTVLHRLEDTPAAGAGKFSDVPSGTWYTNAVAWASGKGIVNGTSDTTFNPNGNITREQLAAILYRYADSLGMDTSANGSLTSFSDADSVSSYASEAMAWAVGAGIINGKTSTTLAPKGNATRAEVSTMLMRLVGEMN